MRVIIPTPLHSYTQGRHAEASGPTLGAALMDLDRRYPGIRFRMVDEQDRIRPHMRVFINGEQEFSLERALLESDVIQIVQALSGG